MSAYLRQCSFHPLMDIFQAIELQDYPYIIQNVKEYSSLNEQGFTPIFMTIIHSDMNAFKIMSSRSASMKNDYGFTPLMLAVQLNKYEFIEPLISSCVKKQLTKQYQKYPKRATALNIACIEGNAELAQLLYQYEADAAKISYAHILVLQCQISHISLSDLSKAKQDIIQNTPLHYYVYKCVQEQKYSRNEDTELSNDSIYLSSSNTMLNTADSSNIQQDIQYLSIFCGYQNSFGLTALMIAVINQHMDLIQALMVYEQRIQSIKLFKYQNYTFYPGFTSLMLSTAIKNYKISQLLIEELGFKTIYGHMAIDFLEVEHLASLNSNQEPSNSNEKIQTQRHQLINGIHKIYTIQANQYGYNDLKHQQNRHTVDINYLGLLRQERIVKFQKQAPTLQFLIENASKLTELQKNKITERQSATAPSNAAIYVSNFEESSQMSQKLSKSSKLREEINQAINNEIEQLHRSCIISSRHDIYGYTQNSMNVSQYESQKQVTSKDIFEVNVDVNVNLYRLEDATELEQQNEEFTHKNSQQKVLFIEDWAQNAFDDIIKLFSQYNSQNIQNPHIEKIFRLLFAVQNIQQTEQDKNDQNNVEKKDEEPVHNPYKNIEIFNYFQYLNRKNRLPEDPKVPVQNERLVAENIVAKVRILSAILQELQNQHNLNEIKVKQLTQELREVKHEAQRDLKKEYEQIIQMLEAEINRIKSRVMVDKSVYADIRDQEKGTMTENLERDIEIQTDKAKFRKLVQTNITLLQQLDNNMLQIKMAFKQLKEISRALQAAVAEYQVNYMALQEKLQKFMETTDEQDILIDFDIQSEMDDLRQLQSQATTMILPSRIMSMNVSTMEDAIQSTEVSPFDSLSNMSCMSTISRRQSMKAQKKKQQKVLLPVGTIASAMQKANTAKMDFQKAKQVQSSLQQQIDEITQQIQIKAMKKSE